MSVYTALQGCLLEADGARRSISREKVICPASSFVIGELKSSLKNSSSPFRNYWKNITLVWPLSKLKFMLM